MPHRAARLLVSTLVAIFVIGTASSCSWVSGLFGDDDGVKTDSVSVFDAKVGDCFTAPPKVKADIADLTKVSCDDPHQQELYAVVDYPTSSDDADFPGASALDTFATGHCAEAFTAYVGVSYLDSGLWTTYLAPSVRSWQQGHDRSVLCFVTTTGANLTASVKGSKQ